MSDSLAVMLERVTNFIYERVIPEEPVLNAGGKAGDETLGRLQAEAKARGIWALPQRKQWGGGGLPLSTYAFLAEVEGRSEWGPMALGSHTLLDAETLAEFASETVQSRYLRGLVAGEIWPSFALTEPGVSGSAPEDVRTRAVFEEDHVRIDGVKWFTSNARRAQYALVVCRTEDGVQAKRAMSVLLVPASSPGYEIVRDISVLGLARDHCVVTYRGVQVPRDHLLGERGMGLAICARRLVLGRTLRCLHWLGLAERAFSLMCARAVGRRSAGELLADKQLVQNMVFESYSEILAVRELLFGLVREFASTSPLRVSAAKVMTSNVLCRVADRAVQLHGAEGLCSDSPLDTLYRAARATRIYDGPDEVHAQSVGQSLLKRYASPERASFASADNGIPWPHP